MKTDSNKTNPKTLLGYLMALAVMVFSFNVSAQTDTITISLVDSYGDSWNGGNLNVGGVDYTVDGVNDDGSNADFDVAVDLSTCINVDYTSGSYAGENSFTISDASGAVLASMTSGYNGFNGTIGFCAVYGCTDTAAANYDAAANTDDGSCAYGTPGCMDTSGCNYDATATVDDGSCTYAATGFDCAGNCLSGVSVFYTAGSYCSEHSFTITDCNGAVLADMSSGCNGFNSCITLPAVYTVTMNDSYNDGWDGATLTVDGVVYTSEGTYDVGACPVYGCTDSLAANYDANADTDDGSCTYGVPGCTDATACNFDAAATADDNSCEFTSCAGCQDASACNYDASATINDSISCTYAATGFDCAGNCLSGVSVVYTSGSYAGENSFTITDCNGTVLAEMTSGLIGFDACTVLGSVYSVNLTDSYGDSWNGGTLTIDGVVYDQPTTAPGGASDSYQVGGACPVYGCIDSLAANYDANADTDDGSCTYGIPGCTDPTACNYDASATADDGNCILAVAPYDCAGNCANGGTYMDINVQEYYVSSWSGSVSMYTLVGYGGSWSLTNLTTGNTFDTSTDDVNDCLPDGCYEISGISGSTGYSFAYSLDGGATYTPGAANAVGTGNFAVGAGVCSQGCTDATAFNYDPSAQADDGSCVAVANGCTDSTMFNYDANANTDDGSCIPVVYGCTNSLAVNYDPTANTDDGTCALGNVGCTDSTACNYDSTATLNDGSCTVDLGCGCGIPAAVPGFDCAGNCIGGGVPVLFTGGAASCTYAGFVITDCSGNVLAEMLSGCTGFDTCLVLPATYTVTLSSAWNLNSDWGSLSIDGVLYGDDPADWPVGSGSNGQSIAIQNDYYVGGAVPGCTDSTACNYDAATNCDDGSCEYATAIFDPCTGICSADVITISLVDSYGDGWNQNSILVNGISYTVQTGASAVFTTCADIANGCVDVEYVAYSGSSWETENSWTITDAFGTILDQGAPVYSFPAPYSYTASFGQGCPVFGCMDTLACNFDPLATDTDSTCLTDYGCTDASACNYDASATCDDGSCLTVYGCMDTNAANYDALATCADTLADGTSVCTYGIPGCTDPLACNYDSVATADDNSCDLTSCYGCMDSTLCGYDATATISDPTQCFTAATGFDCAGNCLAGVNTTLSLTSNPSYNDGWYGMSYDIVDQNGVSQASGTPSGYWASLDIDLCLPDGCYELTQSYTWAGYGWSMAGASGTSASGGVTTGGIVIGNGACPVFGCMDSTALNYDASADTDDNSCTYVCDTYVGTYSSTNASCYGGSDGEASVTVPNAIDTITLSNTFLWSDGQTSSTATGLIAGTYTVTSSDAITGCSITDTVVVSEATEVLISVMVQATMPGQATGSIDATVSGGNAPYAYNWSAALDPSFADSTEDVSALGYDVYTLDVIDGNLCSASWTGIVNEVIVPGCTDSAAFNFDPLANQLDSSCIAVALGCIDAGACNYDALANTDDASCDYACVGCTDSTALNYDASMTIDDGSCAIACAGEQNVTFTTLNNMGGNNNQADGSPDFTYTAFGATPVTVVFTDGDMEANYDEIFITDENGNILNASPYYDVTGQIFSSNVSINIEFDTDGSVTRPLAWTVYCGVYNGCTDSLAANYDAAANTDDGSCYFAPGCTDSTAFNYDASADFDDGSCVAIVNGCTDSTAVNYDASANIDDASCVWSGCTDMTACNYDAAATSDDGSCDYGATPSLENFDLGTGTWTAGGWSQSTSGTTPSTGTGPQSGDPTTTGQFMYIETSSGFTGQVMGTLTSECLNISGLNDPCLIFNHHMYGATMGTLDVLVNGTNVWSLSGDQGDQWNDAQVSLSAFAGLTVTIEFVGTRGTSYTGDIALDNISIGECATILGCTDTTACNFNPSANSDDGSCLIAWGCTDSTAFNYDTTATCDSGCVAVINGCDDITAANYDAAVNTNDGSCLYGIYGCIDSLACNYDSLATLDDGTCYTPSLGFDCAGNCLADTTMDVSVRMDYFGTNYTLVGYSGTWSFTDANTGALVAGTADGDDVTLCLSEGCYDIAGTSGLASGLFAYSLDGGPYIIPGANAGSAQFTVGAGVCPVFGCTDSTAGNYDAAANTDDGSCLYGVPGCTDATACNYDAAATADDGSCTYAVTGFDCAGNCLNGGSAVTISLVDSYGDSWNGGNLNVNGVDYTVGYSDNGGSSASYTICVDLASTCINVDYTSGNYAGENSFTISDGSGAVLASMTSGYNGFNGTIGYCPTYGCTDSLAGNYDPSADLDDGSCLYGVTGCTDALACNYDSAATTDDGSCTYAAAGLDCAGNCLAGASVVYTAGSYAGENSFTITNCNGDTLAEMTSGYNGFDQCVVLGSDYTIDLVDSYGDTWNGGTLTVDGVVYDQPTTMGGGASDSYQVGSCFVQVDGCMDSTANNYDAAANTDDGSCTYDVLGCTDSTANNYDAAANTDDGSCTYDVLGCTDPAAFNYDPLATIDDGLCIAVSAGCTDPTALNYNSGANTDDGSCIAWIDGCTDASACNYDATATVDDNSCEFTSCVGCNGDPITGLFVTDIIDDRAVANFDNMNTYDASGAQVCRVDQIRIRYREVGTNSWSQKNIASPTGYDATTGICNSTQKTDKNIYNLTLGTDYEWEVKTWYCTAGATGWVAGPNFSTAAECPNVANPTAYGVNSTKARFNWDDSNGSYSFVRIKIRVDSISNPVLSDFIQVGGNGVVHGTFTKDKNGLTPGETYRGQGRTWCDPNGGAYNSLGWTSFGTWTQPTASRVEGGTTINNLDVYPNPSRDIFNVSFTSEDVQDLEVRVLNVVGEVVYTENLAEFVGEYTKAIDLATYTKGIYFLEITTNNGVVNKKLILQ